MKNVKVVFQNIEDVNVFINIINKFSGTMELKTEHLCVAATSVLGIINLGLNRELSLHINAEQEDEIVDKIEQFIAA